MVICAGVNARLPSPRLLERPGTGTLTARRVLIADELHFLYFQQAFFHSGDALLAYPVLGLK